MLNNSKDLLENSEIVVDTSNLTKEQAKKLERVNKKAKDQPKILEEMFETSSKFYEDENNQLRNRLLKDLNENPCSFEEDLNYANGFKTAFIKLIDQTQGTIQDKFKFVNTLGINDYINCAKLTKVKAEWNEWLPDNQFIRNLFHNMYNDGAFKQANKGPGEVALALLSPNISLNSDKGDIKVFNTEIEVKATVSAGSSGGNMEPGPISLGNVYQNQRFWKEILAKEDTEIDENGTSRYYRLMNETATYNNFYREFIEKHNLSSKEVQAILEETFKQRELKKDIYYLSQNKNQITPTELAKLGIKNYAYAHGDYNFLILRKDKEVSVFFTLDTIDQAMPYLLFDGHIVSKDQVRGNPVKIKVKA